MSETIELPGLIDLHVHLRDPGQIYKEDFYTGTSAALAGGITTVIDMPNNLVAVTTEELLEEKIASAKDKTVCDIGFNFGTLGDNYTEFAKVADKVVGLKIYLNITTGKFIVDKPKLAEIYANWPSDKPIFLHAEEDVSDLVMTTLRQYPKRTHLCHVSSQKELEFIIQAKKEGLPITCGVTPHHLFLNENDGERLKGFGFMKPFLKSKKDQEFLWSNLDAIDVFESDHAPHTKEEKSSEDPPFGVPGVETMLPLLLMAERGGKLTREQLLEKLYHMPCKILGLEPDENTKIEVDMVEYEIDNEELKTKCGWSPFAGQKVIGKVKKVYIRGNLVYENGQVLAKPGTGQIIS